DINIFVLRQVNNKINTNYLSMTAMCLMLFLTITLLFTAFDLKGTIDENAAENLPFDATAFLVANSETEDPANNDIEKYLQDIDFAFESYEKHSFFNEYKLEFTVEDLLTEYLSGKEISESEEIYWNELVSVIKLSDYNSIRKLKEQKAIDLQGNEVFVVSNYNKLNDA